MRCPVCGSKRTLDDEYGSPVDNMVERKWSCEDCESTFWQQGAVDEDGYVDQWFNKLYHIEPSEQGEVILARKHEIKLMYEAQQRTIPMFGDK